MWYTSLLCRQKKRYDRSSADTCARARARQPAGGPPPPPPGGPPPPPLPWWWPAPVQNDMTLRSNRCAWEIG